MAFHLACPLTCRNICYCSFGDRPLQKWEGKKSTLQITTALKKILASPHVRHGGIETVDILVPCLPKDVKKNKQKVPDGQVGVDNTEDAVATASMRGVIRKKVRVASITASEVAAKFHPSLKTSDNAKLKIARLGESDYCLKIRFKSGATRDEEVRVGAPVRHVSKDTRNVEDLLQPLSSQVVCALCSSAEIIGREGEKRMLSCHGCGKKYHRKCVKQWAEFRDLFNWTSWLCGSCRACEVCRQTGEPNKLMFCKRCDVGLHVYCQQPPLKHVPKGPYLCPEHTRCHSCSSNVPGSGVSSRWFMCFTTCDACGRLFVKDKYCPICLKVYRDSEATPMVCCDSCQHWVHCRCDGISDEKFHQFQSDDNLRYKCAACRGDCHKVTSLDDAVQELWRRRDKSEAELRVKLRAAAALPSEEEMMKHIPFSDDYKQPLSGSHVCVISKKASHSKMKSGKDGKKDVSLSRAVDAHGGNTEKIILMPRNNLKVVSGKSSALETKSKAPAHTEESNDERTSTGDSVKDSFAPSSPSRGLSPIQSWGGHGHSESFRRRRLPSSKVRDMDTNSWQPAERKNRTVDRGYIPGEAMRMEPSLRDHSGDFISRKEGGRNVFRVQKDLNNLDAADDDSSEAPRRGMKVMDIGETRDSVPLRSGITVEGSVSKAPLRLKIMNQVGKNDVHSSRRDEREEEETSTVRVQRSKRKRHSSAQIIAREDIGGANPKTLMQTLGADALSKRVEVFWPIDNRWYRGTVIGVSVQKRQFVLQYDDGDEETLDFGEDRVRLLST